MKKSKNIKDLNKVMKVLTKGKPVSLPTVTYQTGMNDTDAEWALALLMEKGIVTSTKGGKYGLVSGYEEKLEALQKPAKAQAAPKRSHPKKQGTPTEDILKCLSDGADWTIEDIFEKVGGNHSSVIATLSALVKKGEIERVRRGLYRTNGVLRSEEDPTPMKPGISSDILGSFEGEDVWTAKKLAEVYDLDRQSVNSALHYLTKQGMIQKVSHGHYVRKGVLVPQKLLPTKRITSPVPDAQTTLRVGSIVLEMEVEGARLKIMDGEEEKASYYLVTREATILGDFLLNKWIRGL